MQNIKSILYVLQTIEIIALRIYSLGGMLIHYICNKIITA